MTENNKLVLLICSFILLITSGWYIFVVYGGVFPQQTELIAPTQVGDTNGNEQVKAQPTTTSTLPTLAPIPQSKTLDGGKQMFQTFNNCGPASLAMALSYFGYDVSQQLLGQQLRPYQNAAGNNDDKSVTLQELAAKGEEYGLVPYHRAAGNVELMQQFIANDIPVITRTWLEPGEDIGHYRVVKGYDRITGELIQDDSLQGANLRYTYNEFEVLWKDFSYEFLVLVPENKIDTAERILASEGIISEEESWERALEMANTALEESPNDSFAHFNRSVALYHLGRYQEAVDAYETAEPGLPMRTLWYQIEPIQAYYENGDTETVLSLTSNILNNHNRAFSELYYLRAQVYSDLGNETAAAEEMRKAEMYNSTNSWRENI